MANNTVRIRAILDDKVSGPLDKIHDRFDTLGKSKGFKSVAQGVGIGAGIGAWNLLGGAASGAIDFISDSIKAGSDLNETMSKSAVVFGTAADEVSAFGDKAAKSLGLSKKNAVEAAASLGNLFKGLGQTDQASAKMSESLVTLAGDLASFNNIDPTEALEKLRSGLAGESEPLRSVGVFMSEAKVKAKAMQLGFGGAHKELTEGEKVLARYQIILDETTTAQGDFARTSSGMANQQRILTAEAEDLSAKLGERLTPVVIEAQKALIGLIDRADEFNQTIKETTGSKSPLDDFIMVLGTAVEVMADAGTGALSLAAKTEEITGSAKDAADAQYDLVEKNRLTRDAIDKTTAATKTLASSSRDNTRAVSNAFGDMRKSLADDADGLIAEFFDPIEEKEDILAARTKIREAEKVLAHKHTATEARTARDDITGALRDEGTALDKLGEKGKLSAKAVDLYQADVTKAYKSLGQKVPPELQKIIDKLRVLAGIKSAAINVRIGVKDFQSLSGKEVGGNARGGTHPAGSHGTSSENEDFWALPGGGVVIKPNGRSAGSGGGGTTLVINTVWPPTPQQIRLMAQALDQRGGYDLDQASATRSG